MENEENKPVENANESSENKPTFNFEEWLKKINSRFDNIEAKLNQPVKQPKSEPEKPETPIVSTDSGKAVDPDSDFDNYCKIHFDHKEIK